MNWKKFLKLDWRKIVLFLAISSVIFAHVFFFNGYTYPDNGYPLPFFDVIELGSSGQPSMLSEELNYSNILINLVIWYTISFVLIWLYDKVKRK